MIDVDQEYRGTISRGSDLSDTASTMLFLFKTVIATNVITQSESVALSDFPMEDY